LVKPHTVIDNTIEIYIGTHSEGITKADLILLVWTNSIEVWPLYNQVSQPILLLFTGGVCVPIKNSEAIKLVGNKSKIPGGGAGMIFHVCSGVFIPSAPAVIILGGVGAVS
jgi:hypothetical protein